MSDSTSFTGGDEGKAALYKGIGCALAVGSGLLIGSSFVFKKKGLLQSTKDSGGVAGEGYHYLRSVMWWSGMILMILGEICNFVAYAFAASVLVTPLGALSVVISAILSSIFLKEKLTFHGKVGCLQCIIGAVMIVLHAPENIAADASVDGFKNLVLTVGFLVYAGIIVLISLILIFYCGPRWGKKNMLVYIFICSLIGSISVVFTQGFGSAIIYSISVANQFNNWFIYIMLAILVVTLVLEIVYLNKALNLYNTALVTPTYYVTFTTMTIISSTILFQGFKASGTDIASCVMGFLCICSGVALLHHSSAAPPTSTNYDNKDHDGLDKNEMTMKRRSTIDLKNGIHHKASSLLSLFDRDPNHGENQLADRQQLCQPQQGQRSVEDSPNSVEFFSAPFGGITRYASTTRTQSMRLRQNSLYRQQQELQVRGLADTDTAAESNHADYEIYQAPTPHVLRELDTELNEKGSWSSSQGTMLHTIKETDKSALSAAAVSESIMATSDTTSKRDDTLPDESYDHQIISISPQMSLFQHSPSRRDQETLNPVRALRLGLIGNKQLQDESDSDDDRKRLVNH